MIKKRLRIQVRVDNGNLTYMEKGIKMANTANVDVKHQSINKSSFPPHFSVVYFLTVFSS
jgi:hypothetical protein